MDQSLSVSGLVVGSEPSLWHYRQAFTAVLVDDVQHPVLAAVVVDVLDEVVSALDRQVAWNVLGAVLRALRDRVPASLAANLGAQLPLIARRSLCHLGIAP